MKNGDEPRLCSQVLWIFGQLPEGLGCGAEKVTIDDSLISQGHRPQTIRESEDQMKILRWEQILFPSFKPALFVQALAFGAMAVAAGIVGYPQGAAMVALFHVTAKLSGAASLNSPHHPQLPSRHFVAVNFPVTGTVGPKNIGRFKGASHGKLPCLGIRIWFLQ
jgi:hypothetical protein